MLVMISNTLFRMLPMTKKGRNLVRMITKIKIMPSKIRVNTLVSKAMTLKMVSLFSISHPVMMLIKLTKYLKMLTHRWITILQISRTVKTFKIWSTLKSELFCSTSEGSMSKERETKLMPMRTM